MGMGELLAIAVGVSMDAFAIAICKGLSVERESPNICCRRGSGSAGHRL